LHIGRGLALLQWGRGEVRTIRFPVTLPLARQLESVKVEFEQVTRTAGKKKRGLHVTLSAAVCPVVSVPVPANVTRWKERLALARGVAASHAGVAVDDIACDFDSKRPGVAASIPAGVLQELGNWVGGQNLALASLAPLWSLATQCRAVSRRDVGSLVFHEPDSLTVLCDSTDGLRGVSWPSDGDVVRGRGQAENWLSGRRTEAKASVHMGFGAKSAGRTSRLPAVFGDYWTLL
jgi:hypothetical protein